LAAVNSVRRGDFGGGYLSSDVGDLILREVERHSGLLRDFSGCFMPASGFRVLSLIRFPIFAEYRPCSAAGNLVLSLGSDLRLIKFGPEPLITRSGYFSFLELPRLVFWCWFVTVSIRTDFFVRPSFRRKEVTV
jgi:hypothetical protein